MILVDTNIFLEILLNQESKDKCKQFLAVEFGNLIISDFSLHSIGVILLHQKKAEIFNQFTKDVLPSVTVGRLDNMSYPEVARNSVVYGLDFDDAYQFTLAMNHKLDIATMDKDFKKVSGKINVLFL